MIYLTIFALMFTTHITWFTQIDSTNSEAHRNADTAPEGSVWAARFQTKGRGQYDRKWISTQGENLLATLLLRPTFLPTNEQALISKCTALGICDFLSLYGVDARIKWPNDIYSGTNKICGILIEHIISGNNFVASIIGFGININQTSFDGAPNPTSLALETGKNHSPELLLPQVLQCIQKWYQLVIDGKPAKIDSRFEKLLLDIPASTQSEALRNPL